MIVQHPSLDGIKVRHPESSCRTEDAEEAAIKFIRKYNDILMVNALNAACYIDFAVTDPEHKIRAWIEVKCRNKKYDDMIIGLNKVRNGLELAEITGLPYIFIFKFDDDGEIRWRKMVPEDLKRTLVLAGTPKRNDWKDYEPCLMFPLEVFTKL